MREAVSLKATGAEPLVLDLDLREPRSAEVVVSRTLERFGRIDALLNIAGAVPQIDLFEMSDEHWDDGMALKLHGARRLTLRAWEALKAARGAVVLGPRATRLEFPKAPYAAVGTINAAIVALAKAFSDRGLKDGVTVNSVLFFQGGAAAVLIAGSGRRRHKVSVEEATSKSSSRTPASAAMASPKKSPNSWPS